MELLVFDVGGTAIKYAVMNEKAEIIENEHPEFYKFCGDYDLCIYFNTTPIQSKNSQTCSRHCVYRAMLCNIGIEDFMKFYPGNRIQFSSM